MSDTLRNAIEQAIDDNQAWFSRINPRKVCFNQMTEAMARNNRAVMLILAERMVAQLQEPKKQEATDEI